MSISVEGEDTELRDLVAESLEKSGTLGKIKANLRAAVFLTLEEQESFQNKPPLVNQALKSFLNTNEGHLVAGLVQEFLEFYDLDFTLSVFEPETGFKDAYPGREKLAKELKLDAQNKPLLAELLQQSNRKTSSPRSPTLVLDDLKPKSKDDSEKSVSQKEKSKSTASEPQASPRVSKIPQRRQREEKAGKNDFGNLSDDDFFDNILNSKSSSDGKKDKKKKKKGDEEKSTSEKSSRREKLMKSPDAKDLAEIDDKIRKLGYEVPSDNQDAGDDYDDDYEDDFQPSSHISDNGSSVPEEIDEQISIGSLNSSSNRFDDLLTTDRTVSQTSMTGFDYAEDIVDF